MAVSYLSPMNLSVNTPKETSGLSSYTVNNESYFMETLNFITELNAEYNSETKAFYRAIAESGNDSQVINESFSNFFAAVKKLIDKFLAFIKRLVQKFITHLNGLVKSDKYLIKHKDDFKKFSSKNEFNFEGYTYTFENNVPVINALAEFNGEDLSGTPGKDFFDLFAADIKPEDMTKEKADKIAEKIVEKYQALTDSLNGDYYDIFRSSVLNQEGFIPQEDFAAECFAAFRDGTSDKNVIDVTSTYITMIYARFIGNEKFYKSVENDKKRIEKDYNDIKKMLDKLISANYDKKLSTIINLPGGGTIEASKAQELIHQMDLFVKAKSVQVQEMSNIHALAFSAKLDAIKESYRQDKTVLYKALSKIQGTVQEAVIVSDDTIEDDLFNDYLDPVDDQEIIDAIIRGDVGTYDTIAMVQEALVYTEAMGGYKDPSKYKTVAQCNKAIGKTQIKLDKFESNYNWWKGLTKEEQKKEVNKKRFERFALAALSFLVGVIPLYAKYYSDIENGELPADIYTNPDAFYRANIAALKGYIDDLEKRKKELSEMNMSKDDYSYENECANFLFLQERSMEQYMLEKSIAEALVISEGTDVYNRIVSLNEGAFDKIKQGFKKIIEFIKKIFAKFVSTMDEWFKKDSEYLKKYKDIILNKPLKEATYTMPNYANGIKNLTTVKVPYFNYQQMKDDWLTDENQFAEKVFAGKSPAALASQNFSENCKMIFRGSEKDIDYTQDQINMTDLYNYCLEFEKMKKVITDDQKTINNSSLAIDKLIDQLESEYGQKPATPTSSTEGNAEGEAKSESVYSFLYGRYITEADDDKADGKIDIKPSAAGKGSQTAAANTQNIDDKTKADDKDSLQKSAANKSELDEVRKKLSTYSSCCSTLFSTKLSVAQEIYKNYMLIITNHVKNYVGTNDKSTKTKDAETNYSGNDGKPSETPAADNTATETPKKKSIGQKIKDKVTGKK